jgi:hypothetical protein
MSEKYTPRAGSLPSMVINFFVNNPDEELDLEAITDKFSCSRGNVHTQLGAALDAGMLARKRNVDGDYIYTAGKGIPAKQDGVDMDAVHRTPASAAKPAQPKAAPIELPDPLDVPIEDDVPVPGRRTKIDWQPLLSRLKVNQSAKLPLAAKFTISQAITAARKANKGTYTMRTFPKTQELRVWHLA